MIKIKLSSKAATQGVVVVINELKDVPEAPGLLAEGREWLQKKERKPFELLRFQQLERLYIFISVSGDVDPASMEKMRKCGNSVLTEVRSFGAMQTSIINHTESGQFSLALVEGMLLSDYSFEKYLSKKSEKSELKLNVVDASLKKKNIDELKELTDAVCFARDLVNEPQNYLTATQLSREIEASGKKSGFNVEVFNKKKIQSLKMGGILSVNLGSPEPPTFSILEWKPSKPKNKKPIVLVGKGVVYDTGGLSLKPTPNSMDLMKSDMAGAAVMIGTMQAIARNKLNVHVIALIPASDNRPGMNAYAPGDIITMYDGTTVEVLNTDAEGRLLLADALSYAKKFDPELVIEASTLTGAAVRAVGEIATAVMGTADRKTLDQLNDTGLETYERTIEFPLWEEYGNEIKSKIADLKNLGGPLAGQIHAGKFLEHFTDYPFIHCDIAGPSFLSSPKSYLPAGGTGTGVRLFYHFIKKHFKL